MVDRASAGVASISGSLPDSPCWDRGLLERGRTAHHMHPPSRVTDYIRSLLRAGSLLGLLAACGLQSEDLAGSDAALATQGRWALPKDVLRVGATVRLHYDGAPSWNRGACAGTLTSGATKLGEYVLDEFAAVASVGGYDCRPNTANQAKLSVHGTGRAIDVFVPKVEGRANNRKGDEIANWLVANAGSIGVQLVIWDRTVWQANGKNDKPYSGPHPHDDHIHVELTEEAAAMSTPWFTARSTRDVGESDETTDARRDPADAGKGPDASKRTDPPPRDPPDAHPPDDHPPDDPSPEDPPSDDLTPGAGPPHGGSHDDDAAKDRPPSDATPAKDPPSQPQDTEDESPSSNVDWRESEADMPGERDSLTTSSSKKRTSQRRDERDVLPPDGAGPSSCSAAPSSRGASPAPPVVALVIAAGAIRRRRRGS